MMDRYLVEFIHPDWPEKVEFRTVCQAGSEGAARYIGFLKMRRQAPHMDGLTEGMARVTRLPPLPPEPEEVVLRVYHSDGKWSLSVDGGPESGWHDIVADAVIDASGKCPGGCLVFKVLRGLTPDDYL